MKTFILLIFFSLSFYSSKAQSFAVINDKDGFVNVRNDKNAKSIVVGKIHINELFYYDVESKSDWTRIFNYDGKGSTGYIYSSKILPLNKFKCIKRIKIYRDSSIAANDTFKVIVKSQLFYPKKHKLSYSAGYLTKIDGKQIWGTDGAVPKKSISINILKNGIPIVVPEEACDNLYEPDFKTLKVYFGTNNTIYVEMDNSDGAGGYSIIWIIKDGRYLKRYLDNTDA